MASRIAGITVEIGGDTTKLSKALEGVNNCIGKDGRVSLCVEEKNRSWCSSSAANDQRAITIECASDLTHPYAMNSAVYTSLIKLCTDICKRNGKTKLLWLGDKNKTLNYAPAPDEMVLTVHRWYANKACPGDWLYSRLGELAAMVTTALGTPAVTTGLQAASLKDMEPVSVVAKVAPLFTANQRQSGILASVSMAQFILESGYGKSELAQNANNCFGMKASLSGNTWSGSAWDGNSVYTMKTGEQNTDGSYVSITADFRRYNSIEDSINDHSAYLLGAMNGNQKRYEGLAGCTDYKKAVQIIKDGGYATSLDYVQKLCRVIEQWNLTQYDASTTDASATGLYRVRKNWSDAASQRGRSVISVTQRRVRTRIPVILCSLRMGKQSIPPALPSSLTRFGCPLTAFVSARAPARTTAPMASPARESSPLSQKQKARAHPSGGC